MAYKIPLTADPDQNFKCTVPINNLNISLFFRLKYNTVADYWMISVSDSKRNTMLDNIPLVTGVNILDQFSYLGIGSAMIINTGNNSSDSPTDSNISDFTLVWGDTIG
jgi:hypothetical protein